MGKVSKVVRAHVRSLAALAAVAAVAAPVAAATPAQTTAAPSPTSNPTIEGPADQPFVGDTLHASNGTWTGSPTSFKYQWDRCAPTGDRQGCGPIAGATSKSYTVQKADVDHTLRVRVTATNADGSATKDSKGTGVVADKVAPAVKTRPTIAGSAKVGAQLTADPGTWSGAVSFAYQWQQCSLTGAACTAIAGATAKTYTVRTADVDHVLRVEVTATNKYGSTKAYSSFTDGVTTGTPTTTTTVVTTTVAGNRAPTIRFLSLKVLHNRVYVRFRVCDDSPGKITVVDRDQLTKRLAYTRKLGVRPAGCGTYARHWLLIQRFRGHGRFVVTLRAIDKSGRLSRPASRSLHR